MTRNKRQGILRRYVDMFLSLGTPGSRSAANKRIISNDYSLAMFLLFAQRSVTSPTVFIWLASSTERCQSLPSQAADGISISHFSTTDLVYICEKQDVGTGAELWRHLAKRSDRPFQLLCTQAAARLLAAESSDQCSSAESQAQAWRYWNKRRAPSSCC